MRPQHPFLDPGAAFAHYEIRSVVGRGGMGVVYQARDVRLDRTVALKLLAPEFTAHENFRARFLRESRLAAAVDHPNIIPIYEAGDADGTLFIAMRFVRGVDLRSEIDHGRYLEPPVALDLLRQVADALDAAHAAGLVHRDVKPGNVLLTAPAPTGRRHAYLTDFGLTRRSASISGLTATGQFLGTLDYVAPEQIRGEAVDGRADVYSFACMAYRVLVGQQPFGSEDDVALMWAHLSRTPPRAASVRPELAGDVDDALAAGLAKAREDRPRTCGELVDLMEGREPQPGTAVAPPGPERAPDEEPWAGSRSDRPSHPSFPSRPAGSPSGAGRRAGPPPAGRPARANPPRGPVPAGRPGPGRSAPHAPPHRPAAADGGPRPGPPRRGGRSRAVAAAAGALAVLAVAATAGVVLLTGGEDWTTVSADGVPYTLEVPEDWTQQLHDAGDSSVSVFSPTDLTALFADEPAGMAAAAEAAGADPGSVVGLAIYHRPRLDGDTAAAQLPAAQALLPGQDADLRPGDASTVGDLPATGMTGTLGLGGDASLQLRVWSVESSPRQLLVFFAPPSVYGEHADTFDRVAASVTATG
ncbi:protein kinase [Geodermatophilus sp. YIM 151500]|uniref:serine/threonine-protein kinase n=1 Tax=Geodermatophilus sp. YIM 151500 TaxID=2984531 RepID=UPI0021E4F806|nr:serine/threonine-protein kinase [Geodermatophilus sp. YIM 151500]MCV2491523.1 protein kinase [Geodermatophilus sp. YIM 151500]